MYTSGGRKESFFPSTTSQLGEGVGEGFKLSSPKLPLPLINRGEGVPPNTQQYHPPSRRLLSPPPRIAAALAAADSTSSSPASKPWIVEETLILHHNPLRLRKS